MRTGVTHQPGVAIGRGLGHRVATDGAASAGAILNEYTLIPARAQFLRHDTRQTIRRTAGRLWHDDSDLFGWKSTTLRERGWCQSERRE